MADLPVIPIGSLLEAEILLIGGAPRSGTSALVGALDWHPQVLMFPFEINAIRPYYAGGPDGFRRFLEERYMGPGMGKQALFADPASLGAFLERRRQECYEDGVGLHGLSPEAYRRAYEETLGRLGRYDLHGAMVATAAALLAALPGLRCRYGSPERIAFKVPFWVEFHAARIAGSIPRSRFVQILREPVSRYASVKVRSLRPHGDGKAVLPMNGLDYPTAQMDIDITSRALAEKNRATLPGRYHVLTHEEFVQEREGTMRGLCGGLGLRWDPILLEQTLFGRPLDLESSFGFRNADGGDDRRRRFDGRMWYTSPAERRYLKARAWAARDGRILSDAGVQARLRGWMSQRWAFESSESHARRLEFLARGEWHRFAGTEVVERTRASAMAPGFSLI